MELLFSSGAFIASPPPQIGVFCSGISNFSILDNNEDLVRWKAGGTGGAKTSVFDHGTLYGDGIFEGIRFYNKRVFRLEDHMDRLYNCSHYLLLDIPYTQEELSNAVCETVAASGLNDGYIRLVVTRGVGNLGLNPFNCKRSCVFIIADKISLYDPNVYENGLALITSSVRRNRPDTVCPQVKSLNYLNNILAKMEAVRQGAAEALMLNDLGNVAECTGDNIFIVKDGTVFTPPVTDGCLDGITRRVVLENLPGAANPGSGKDHEPLYHHLCGRMLPDRHCRGMRSRDQTGRLSAGLWKNRSCYSSNPGPFPGTGPDHGNILLKSANPFLDQRNGSVIRRSRFFALFR